MVNDEVPTKGRRFSPAIDIRRNPGGDVTRAEP
jgi:hypothetical protein